jgi:glycine betaine/choline ABC-type transport system substrate-binding protein
MRRLLSLALMLALVAAVLGGCDTQAEDTDGDTSDEQMGPIVIGSKIDVEGPVLGYLMAAALEAEGFEVVDRMRTGATDVVRRALLAGEIDAYPEYTANAITVFFADEEIDPSVLTDARATYEMAAELDRENEGSYGSSPRLRTTRGPSRSHVSSPKATLSRRSKTGRCTSTTAVKSG